MEDYNFNNSYRESDVLSLEYPRLIRKVYVWMAFALVISALTAYGVAHNIAILNFIFGGRFTFLGLLLGEVALVLWLSTAINRLSLQTATLLFILYSVLNGATLSAILLVYSPVIITKVLLITAGTFGAAALFGSRTEKDLSGVGRFLMLALIGIIIASLVNLWFKSPSLDWVLSYVGVAVFVGLTVWDAQKIRQMLLVAEDDGEAMQRVALMGALTLYLDFVNLFLHLLRIFGGRK